MDCFAIVCNDGNIVIARALARGNPLHLIMTELMQIYSCLVVILIYIILKGTKMSLDIPKITSAMRKVDFSSLTRVDMTSLKKVDMSKIDSIFPNPAVKKVNYLEAVKKFIEKFLNK